MNKKTKVEMLMAFHANTLAIGRIKPEFKKEFKKIRLSKDLLNTALKKLEDLKSSRNLTLYFGEDKLLFITPTDINEKEEDLGILMASMDIVGEEQ